MVIDWYMHYEYIYNNLIFSEFEIQNQVCPTFDVGATSIFMSYRNYW